MKTRRHSASIILLGSIFAILGLFIFWVWHLASPANSTDFDRPGSSKVNSTSSANKNSQPSQGTQAASISTARTHDNLLKAIEQTLAELLSQDPERIKQALDRLDELLSGDGHDAQASIAAILDFLKTGKDALTGEGFQVGENGVLEAANTLRVFLLDHLGTLCREAGSKEALDMAKQILSGFGSADEWAVCLRNTAWLDPQSQPLLTSKMQEMLSHEPWLKEPSIGMLEAFDVVAYSGSLDLIPRLSGFLQHNDDHPLWRASIVALDQMATLHPAEVVDWLSKNPEMLNEHPMQRADLYSKVDLTDPAQKQAIEAVLARQDLSVKERSKILSGLLTPGNFLSNNLLTKQPVFNEATERRRLDLVNQIGSEWLASGRFSDLTSALNDLVKRSTLPTK